MREIITLQLGHLSNYTATHFWNAQESYFTYDGQDESLIDHNVHWRAGIGQDGADTFLPRTVIYDLKGGFGSLRKINDLYDVTSTESTVTAHSLWRGKSAVHKQQVIEQSDYQQSLDEGTTRPQLTEHSVRYWSDFSHAYYHPKSLVQLYDFELNSTIRPFERFAMGTELFDALDREHDIIDRDWRPFVEECDLMQGVQVFTTLDDAWGGFASSYLEELRDEYPKSCLWVWGLQNPLANVPREKRQLRLANTAQCLSNACPLASMVVPLSLPETQLPLHLAVEPGSPWHVSALLSAAAETAAIQSRMRVGQGNSPASLSDVAEGLNTSGNQTLASCAMDVGHHADEGDRSTLDLDLFRVGREANAAPGTDEARGRIFGQLSSYRGTSEPLIEEKGAPTPRPLPGNPHVRRFNTRLQFPLLDSYPHIYKDASSTQPGISIRTVLSTTTAISARISTLRAQVSRSVVVEERENLSNGLAVIADAYRDDWSSGSDEDNDDM
ncbi:Tubulin FtsZ [Drechmeria coniospora]|uniref:Tubulin FtsZ n=1 Tax=Drechmeria coniospora TaxID=98403 RepID=A0A151GBV3_DRECN|nr:Tubulin FtsZ [Drechmeria coniospora]KYK54588.1 Tubulin FtsZ [Drechmeria coniospora]